MFVLLLFGHCVNTCLDQTTDRLRLMSTFIYSMSGGRIIKKLSGCSYCLHLLSENYTVRSNPYYVSKGAKIRNRYNQLPHLTWVGGNHEHKITFMSQNRIWAVKFDFQQCGILTSVGSDEPVQPPFKPRNLKWGPVSSLTVIEYLSDQQRFWSVCAYAQASLSLCWTHIPNWWKSHATAHFRFDNARFSIWLNSFSFFITKICPPVKYFYWPFQGGASFVDHLCFCVLCLSCFRVCSLLPCGHLLGKGWPLGYCWWCLLYFCYYLMWYMYPGSGVVLDCIVSWHLPFFLLSTIGAVIFAIDNAALF